MKRQSLSSDELETLVINAQNGHEEDFSQLYDYFFDRIFKYVSFRVKPEHTEDLVADIFLKMVQNLNRYKPQSNASFASWLFRLAHNHVIDHYRRQKELLIGENEDEELDSLIESIPDSHHTIPDDAVQKNFEAQQIQAYLTSLKPSYQEILELKFFQDLSNREIAEITGKGEGNIRIIQLRALKELREKMESHTPKA